MKFKKLISLVTVLALVLSLAACGASNTESGDNAPESDSDSGSADSLWNKRFDGVTLKRILWYEPSDSEKALVKEFTDRTGATVVDEVVDYQNYTPRLQTQLHQAHRTISAIFTVHFSRHRLLRVCISR